MQSPKYNYYILKKNAFIKNDLLNYHPDTHFIMCELDYDAMKENFKDFHDELVEYVYHPDRLLLLCSTYGMQFHELLSAYNS